MEFQYPLQTGTSNPCQCFLDYLYLLKQSCFSFPELDLLTCLLSKDLFLIFVELYLKYVSFWLFMLLCLYSSSQLWAPSAHSWPSDLFLCLWWVESVPACITEHLNGPITDINQHCNLSCGNNFAGKQKSSFAGQGCCFINVKCVKAHQGPVIRPIGIFSFLSSQPSFFHFL